MIFYYCGLLFFNLINKEKLMKTVINKLKLVFPIPTLYVTLKGERELDTLLDPKILKHMGYRPGDFVTPEMVRYLRAHIEENGGVLRYLDYGIEINTIHGRHTNAFIESMDMDEYSEVKTIRPYGYILPLPDIAGWINIGILKLLPAKVTHILLGGKVPRPSQKISAVLQARPDLYGPCEKPMTRLLENFIEMATLLMSPTDSMYNTLMELSNEDCHTLALALPSRALMLTSNVNNSKRYLPAINTVNTVIRGALGCNLPELEVSPQHNEERAWEILSLYYKISCDIDKTLIPGKTNMLKRTFSTTKSPWSARTVLITIHPEDTNEMELADAALIIQWMAQLINKVKKYREERGEVTTASEVYLYIKSHTHRPCEDIYRGLEEILDDYKKVNPAGAPFICIRWPSTRPANINVFYVKRILRQPNKLHIGLAFPVLRLKNADTDGDEITTASIPLCIADKYTPEIGSPFNHRQHYLACNTEYEPKLISMDSLYLSGIDLYTTTDNRAKLEHSGLTLDQFLKENMK